MRWEINEEVAESAYFVMKLETAKYTDAGKPFAYKRWTVKF